MDYSALNDNFLVPDRGDIVRDKLKYYWRRIAFYLFTVFFVFYTVRLPSEVQVRKLFLEPVSQFQDIFGTHFCF